MSADRISPFSNGSIRIIQSAGRYRLVERAGERFVQQFTGSSGYLGLAFPIIIPSSEEGAIEQFKSWLKRECGVQSGNNAKSPVRAYETEEAFLQDVIELLKLRDWNYYHTHDSRKSPAGFLDLVCWRDRQLEAELKVGGNKPTAKQQARIDWLRAHGLEVHLWYPEDWQSIQEALR